MARKPLKEDGADPAGPGGARPARLPMYFAAKGVHAAVVKLLLGYNAAGTIRQGSTMETPRCALPRSKVTSSV